MYELFIYIGWYVRLYSF